MNDFKNILFSTLQFLDELVISPVLERFYLESIYFLPSLLVAVLFIYSRKRKFGFRTFYCAFLSRRIWGTQSTKIDFASLVLNIVLLGAVGMLLNFMIVGDASRLSSDLGQWLRRNYDLGFEIENAISASVVATLLSFIVFDFCLYWFHRALHNNKYLWTLHSRHHSAKNLTPLTNFRGHPIEVVCKLPITAVGSVIVGGLSEYISKGQSQEIVILGTNIFAFLVLFFGGSLVHSHIFLCFPRWLSRIVVSPAMHQVHHSVNVKHFNKNYGSSLAIWDCIFGSIYLPNKHEKIRFGLTNGRHQHDSIWVFMFGKTFCSALGSFFNKKHKEIASEVTSRS